MSQTSHEAIIFVVADSASERLPPLVLVRGNVKPEQIIFKNHDFTLYQAWKR